MAIAEKSPTPNRYRADPSVLTALKSPRLLTREVLAGLVVAMALIPEAISFSIIAGVDPRVGLFSSFVMAVSIAFLGGRPAMITAATGAIALVVAPLVRDRGLDYLIVAVILAGIFQIVLGLLGVAKLMRLVSVLHLLVCLLRLRYTVLTQVQLDLPLITLLMLRHTSLE